MVDTIAPSYRQSRLRLPGSFSGRPPWFSKANALASSILLNKFDPSSLKRGLYCKDRIFRNLAPLFLEVDDRGKTQSRISCEDRLIHFQ